MPVSGYASFRVSVNGFWDLTPQLENRMDELKTPPRTPLATPSETKDTAQTAKILLDQLRPLLKTLEEDDWQYRHVKLP